MKFKVVFRPDGKSVDFEGLDRPGVDADTMDVEELRRRLHHPAVGADLVASLSAVRAIVAHLLNRPELLDDVRHTLALIDQASQNALFVNAVERGQTVIASEYQQKVFAVQRILAGDVPLSKNGIRVADGLFQFLVARLLETRQAEFKDGSPDDRARIVGEVGEEIFFLVGRRPSSAITLLALEVAGRKGRPPVPKVAGGKGRPPGVRERKPPTRKNEVFNALLKEVGLAAGSHEALELQRKRRKKRAVT